MEPHAVEQHRRSLLESNITRRCGRWRQMCCRACAGTTNSRGVWGERKHVAHVPESFLMQHILRTLAASGSCWCMGARPRHWGCALLLRGPVPVLGPCSFLMEGTSMPDGI